MLLISAGALPGAVGNSRPSRGACGSANPPEAAGSRPRDVHYAHGVLGRDEDGVVGGVQVAQLIRDGDRLGAVLAELGEVAAIALGARELR